MLSIYKVKYRRGFMGETLVTAADYEEAKREAIATCRYFTGNAPRFYGFDDIVESIEPYGEDKPVGGFGYQYRPTVQTKVFKNYC